MSEQYKKRKIRDLKKFMKNSDFEGVNNVSEDKLLKMETKDIPTVNRMKNILDDLEKQSTVITYKQTPKEIKQVEKMGVMLPKKIRQKTEKEQKRVYNRKNKVDEIMNYLPKKAFTGTYKINKEKWAELDNDFKIPTIAQIKKDYETLENKSTIDDLPMSFKQLEAIGVYAPDSILQKVKVRTINQAPDKKEKIFDLFGDIKISKKDTLNEIFDKAIDNPSEVEIDGIMVPVSKMRNELMSEFQYIEDSKRLPVGDSFISMWRTILGQISNMSNNQIIALYGYYNTDNLLDKIIEYDSDGDGRNTKGIKYIKERISDSMSF